MRTRRAWLVLVFAVIALLIPTVTSKAGPRRAESIIISLTTDKPKYSIQDTVKISLTVRNRTGATISYDFPTSQWYDLHILKEGKVIWKWSRGKFFTQSFTTLVLKPGQSRIFVVTWDLRDDNGNPVLPGNYVAAAIFPVRMSATGSRDMLTASFLAIKGFWRLGRCTSRGINNGDPISPGKYTLVATFPLAPVSPGVSQVLRAPFAIVRKS